MRSRLVELVAPATDRLLRQTSYFSFAAIPGGTYRGTPNDVETFGVVATVVASTRTSAEAVYRVVKAVLDDLQSFRKLYPALGGLQARAMLSEAPSAPAHDGALRYYRQRRLEIAPHA